MPDFVTTGLAGRLRVIAALRRDLADRAETFAVARPGASAADVLMAELLPLLAACRFLERRAARILRPKAPRGRPVWLFGTRLRVRRIPLGHVLVIGPANYPLFLPGVQVLQALVAGNRVSVKPAPGCTAPMAALAAALARSGLPDGMLRVLAEDPAAIPAILASVDHVVLTGSAATGRAVLALLAPMGIPATMELSGRDPMVVLPGADPDLAARAAAYGLTLNDGRTCIAPRRIIVVDGDPVFRPMFRQRLMPLLAGSARVVDAEPGDAWVHEDSFTAVASLHAAADEDEAVRLANAGPHALGASVFGPPGAARLVAARLRAGCVVVNDMIVPTADPALPFGGAGASGFGATRGAEGLLALTRPQAVVERTWPTARHLVSLADDSVPLVAGLLRLLYGRRRLRIVATLTRAVIRSATGATTGRDP